MTWFKFDDNAVDHPKVASLTDRAFRWWVRGLSYASRFLTNGILPPIFWKQVPKQSRAELTGNTLWDWEDPNFKIHDYELYQTTKEDVDDLRARNREKAHEFIKGCVWLQVCGVSGWHLSSTSNLSSSLDGTSISRPLRATSPPTLFFFRSSFTVITFHTES